MVDPFYQAFSMRTQKSAGQIWWLSLISHILISTFIFIPYNYVKGEEKKSFHHSWTVQPSRSTMQRPMFTLNQNTNHETIFTTTEHTITVWNWQFQIVDEFLLSKKNCPDEKFDCMHPGSLGIRRQTPWLGVILKSRGEHRGMSCHLQNGWKRIHQQAIKNRPGMSGASNAHCACAYCSRSGYINARGEAARFLLRHT